MGGVTTKTMPEGGSAAGDPRWRAVVARAREADGAFYYAVATTGVYCRPSCGSRQANPKNVRFYETTAEAERAGFRPCRRCRPDQASLDQQHAARVAEACRAIDASATPPGLSALARRAGLSAYHFHRVFRTITGLTPRQCASGRRADRVRQALATRSTTVTDAIYDAGFNSSGRFYEATSGMLGMTPTAYRAGGAATVVHFAVGECSLGAVLVAQSGKGVCAILLGDDPAALVRDLQDRLPTAILVGADPTFERTIATVIASIETPARGRELPLDLRGTAFQQRVWQALREIPPGSTASYAQIAARIGAPTAARAVASACAANPVAVVVPCHRVVRTDGGVSGYRWGIERKRALLSRESALKSL